MRNLHPSSSAKQGHRPSNPITTGVNRDLGPYREAEEVFCKQCGFPCNLGRDARNVDQFAGETIGKGFTITDHVYTVPYDGTDRTTTDLTEDLSNGTFEDWTAGDPDDWTVSGTTITEETAAGYYDADDTSVTDSSSAKFVRSSSDVSLSQTLGTPSDFNDDNIVFRARVKCTTRGVIRLRVAINSINYDSGYNRGQQNFEDITISIKCPVTVSSLIVYLLADSEDGTAYVDNVRLMRDSNPTTVTPVAGCAQCGSYNYY